MDNNRMVISDEEGNEYEMEIIFTFEGKDGKMFVLFRDPEDTEGDVYAYQYDEDGNLDAVTDPEDVEMCAEVLDAYMSEEELADGEA